MKQFAENVKIIADYYQKFTKPFSFPYDLKGHECTIHVYIVREYKPDRHHYWGAAYSARMVATSKTMAPKILNQIYIPEELLVHKNDFFHENQAMFDELIRYLKQQLYRAGILQYLGGNVSKPQKFDDNHFFIISSLSEFIRDALETQVGKIRERNIMLEKLTKNELDDDDKILIIKDRSEYLPDEFIKAINAAYDSDYYINIKELAETDHVLSLSDYEQRSSCLEDQLVFNDIYHSEKKRYEDYIDSMDIDWKVLDIVMDEEAIDERYLVTRDSWQDKYVRYALGKTVTVIKDGKECVINPRREFFENYSIIANVNRMVSDELLDRIDNLQPIEGLTLIHEEYRDLKIKLTHSVLKYLKGQFYNCNKADVSAPPQDRALIPLAIIAKGFPRDWWPNFDNKWNEKQTLSYLAIKMKNDGICDLRVMEKIRHSFHRFYFTTKEPSPYYFLDDINCSFRDYLKKIIAVKGGGIIDTKRVSIEIIDTVKMFANKVIFPIAVFLSNKDDYSKIVNVTPIKFMFEIFGDWGNGGLIKFYKMAKIVHDRGDYFTSAGNNPASLIDYDNTNDMDSEMKSILGNIEKELLSDEVRKKTAVSHDVQWPGIINKAVTTPDGKFHFIPLLSFDQLKEEGREMSNCVGWGGYADKSFSGESKIFSVRDDQFARVATMEVSINDDYDDFKVIQLYGYDNDDVTDNVIKAAEWFTKQINEGNLSVDKDALKMERKIFEKKEHGNSYVSHVAGYAITEEGIRAAMLPWKPFLPRELYNGPLSKWLEVSYIKNMVNNINEDEDAIIIDENGEWREG